MFKRLVAEYHIKPWNFDKLSIADVQEINLAEHAEAYKQQELRKQNQSNSKYGQRSQTNSKSYKQWKQRMEN